MVAVALAVLMWCHADSLEKKTDQAVAGGIPKGEGNGLHGLSAVDKHHLCLVYFAINDIFNWSISGLLLETVCKIVRAQLGNIRQFFQCNILAHIVADVFNSTVNGILAACCSGLVWNGEKNWMEEKY